MYVYHARKMVFNVVEETARGDQQQQPSFTKQRQRKSSSSNRKSKAALSQIVPGAEARIETSAYLEYTKTNLDGASSQSSMSQNEMGNKNSTPSFCDESLNATDYNSYIPKEPADAVINSSICIDSHTTKGKLEHKNETPNISGEDTAASQISKLKSLLLLQISLIGRQQDLLRLRDREIMQLKASNTNYKCQLNRVRRRISKRKDVNDEPTSPKASSIERKLVENSTDPFSPLDATSATLLSEGESKPSIMTHSFAGNTNCSDSKLPQTSSKFIAKESTERVTQHSDKSTTFISQTSQDPSKQNMEVLLTPTNDKSAVPVPLAFVEQKQAELMEAMMISPPEKAIRTFCDITNTSPSLVDFPFKICNRCPHCVAIATEITRLFKNAEQFSSPDPVQATIDRARTEELLKLSAVSIPSSDVKDDQSKDVTKCTSILRTSVSYFRFSPTFDSQHWWWDLKCGNIKTENPLKIPTWKENELLPLISTSNQDITEATDDQTFIKRHMKHELDEKRRKRWDIQRIREYRYNEKLRQKLLKQGAVYEAPFVETFSGHLHDAESVEVHECLPVNVFGYPAPHLEPEEFSLPLTEDAKAITSGVSRKKVRKN